ncbi:hypothetical protein [Arcticibacterium luteifluviistationis]|uniref:GLPGLI family protein n=1 Tax=Arcticibacterium luteifluviistationis TaxID=1784714 RepID=A0A2Z4GBD2_9BACT|nr:hypothetical protein [Arcticibacterium luteifluviistationis]AWV98243.1 hypothetical protein DJ013_08700 [Arcticibacterium luteifluviistationis]
MKKIILLLLIPFLGIAQNYNAAREMAQNPSYILEEYYEIIKSDSAKPEILHFTKYLFQGSTIEKKEYALGTPYLYDQEWHKGSLKLPGQDVVKGYLSYNMVYQRVHFKSNSFSNQRILVEPEFFIINDVTYTSFPDVSPMAFAYFTNEKTGQFNLLCDNRKVQSNDINKDILDPYNITSKEYTAEYIEKPEYFIFKDGEAFKIEDKNYFYKQFGLSKKELKQFKEDRNINFQEQESVAVLLAHLSKQ